MNRFFTDVLFPYIDKHGITTIIFLGDLIDRRKYINFETLKFMDTCLLDPLLKRNIDVHLLLGNHDIYFKNTSEVNSPDLLLSKYTNIKIYDKPQDVTVNGITLSFIPWLNDNNMEDFKKYLPTSKASLAFGHLEIKGFQVLRGILSEHGLDKEELKNFEFVYSGHFHQKQDNGQIYYLGTQYDLSFSDVNEKKGFHILDLNTRKLEFIENPYKLFYKVVYDDKDINQDFSKFTDCYVKLLVKKKTDVAKFDKYLENLYNSNPADVSIIEEFTLSTDSPDEIDQSDDTLSLISKEIDYLESTDVDKTTLKRLINELYHESFEVKSDKE